MDLTKSMEDDKYKLAMLGDLLADQMSKITKNFRLGFGSFAGITPDWSTVSEKLLDRRSKYLAPYGFRNHMKLSVQTMEFRERVSKVTTSGNLHGPKGGIDAIMQSIVCENEIGWRENSRKIIVFSTNSAFHNGGDGKRGGTVKPNDLYCRINSSGYYNENTHMDHPSLSQLNMKVKERNVNLIFAVTRNQIEVYEGLSQNLEGASTGLLAEDSWNVIDLIKQQYEKITSKVDLRDTAQNEFVDVSYYSKCVNDLPYENTNVCRGLRTGTIVDYEVRFRLKKCPTDPKDWKKTIVISPVGINEQLTVNLEMLCQCNCEKPENRVRSLIKCRSNGIFQCGICDCDDGYFGRQCECSPDIFATDFFESKCIPKTTSSTTELTICSNRGQCICNYCDCFNDSNGNPLFYGTYCECSDKSCPRHKGKLCGGQGSCICNKCHCNEGWENDACSCSSNTSSCIAPGSTLVCNGKGVCECGICKCSHTEPYWGQYCDECPTCGGKCSLFRDCVQCKVFETGEYGAERCKVCQERMNVVGKVEVQHHTEQLCVFRDEADDCKFTFVYGYDQTNKPYIRVERTKDCPQRSFASVVYGIAFQVLSLLWH